MLALARKLGFKLQRDPGNPNVTHLRLALDAPAR
jgi:acetyltransferase